MPGRRIFGAIRQRGKSHDEEEPSKERPSQRSMRDTAVDMIAKPVESFFNDRKVDPKDRAKARLARIRGTTEESEYRTKKCAVGKHCNWPDDRFDPVQLKKGIQVEYEHTGSEELAKEIAKDHLAEMPDYYMKLEIMEGSKAPWQLEIDRMRSEGKSYGAIVDVISRKYPSVALDKFTEYMGDRSSWDSGVSKSGMYFDEVHKAIKESVELYRDHNVKKAVEIIDGVYERAIGQLFEMNELNSGEKRQLEYEVQELRELYQEGAAWNSVDGKWLYIDDWFKKHGLSGESRSSSKLNCPKCQTPGRRTLFNTLECPKCGEEWSVDMTEGSFAPMPADNLADEMIDYTVRNWGRMNTATRYRLLDDAKVPSTDLAKEIRWDKLPAGVKSAILELVRFRSVPEATIDMIVPQVKEMKLEKRREGERAAKINVTQDFVEDFIARHWKKIGADSRAAVMKEAGVDFQTLKFDDRWMALPPEAREKIIEHYFLKTNKYDFSGFNFDQPEDEQFASIIGFPVLPDVQGAAQVSKSESPAQQKECSLCTMICSSVSQNDEDTKWCKAQFSDLKEGKLSDKELASRLDAKFGPNWEDRVLKKQA